MSKISRHSEDLTRSGSKLSVVKALQESEILESYEDREQDEIAQDLQQPMHRSLSYSMLMLERKNPSSEDPAAMTIEFLRARLISERNVSKAAKQRAQLLAKKVIELQRKLEDEVAKRQKAEAALDNFGQASAIAMETNDATSVSSFRQMLLKSLSSQEYSGSCSSDNDRAKAEIFEGKVISAEESYSHKGKGLLSEEEPSGSKFDHQDNYPYQDAYCYGPWSFVYSGNDETTSTRHSRNEKEASRTLSDEIPAIPNRSCQTESRHANGHGVLESSYQKSEDFLSVSQVTSVPAIQQDFAQGSRLSPPGLFARHSATFTGQKTRDSGKDEHIGQAILSSTTRGGSSREDRRNAEHGCSIHASNIFGSKSKLQSPSDQLCKKHHQENKRGMVGNSLHYNSHKDAQTPGIMAAGLRRKLEGFNPKQLINKGLRKGTTTFATHDTNTRDQSMKEFDSNIQDPNSRAGGRLLRPASGYFLQPGVAEPICNVVGDVKAQNRKFNFNRSRRSIYVQDLPNSGEEDVSCTSTKDLKHSSLKPELYAHDSVHTQYSESTVDPSAAMSCIDCEACSRLKNSRNIIRTVPRRSDKYIQQQLECLEMSASASAADRRQTRAAALRRTQSYVELSNSAPTSQADCTQINVANCDTNDSMVYSIQRSSEQLPRKTLSEYLSLDMEAAEECLDFTEQMANTGKENIEKTDLNESQNEIRICIQERPNESVIRQENTFSEEVNLQAQQITPSSEAQIALIEPVHPIVGSMDNFLCDARNLRDDEISQYIGNKDISGEYSCSLHNEYNPAVESSVPSHYFGNRNIDCLTSQEIEFAADSNLLVDEVRSPHVYPEKPEEMGYPKPSHYLVLPPNCSTKEWHDQEHSSMLQVPWRECSRAQLVPAARSTRNLYHLW